MFSIAYNCLLALLCLLILPKFLWARFRHGKYKNSLLARLGFTPPPSVKGPVIWIHAVSVGETRALIPLYKLLHHQIVISNTTETGHEEAKRSMPDAAAHFYLPLDFSWIMRRYARALRPKLLILVESDFWYHHLLAVKEQGGHTALVNGKISERAVDRFSILRFFSRRLFALIDLFCLQSKRFLTRFETLSIPPEKLHITGNLKFDATPQLSDLSTWRKRFNLLPTDTVITLGSTHAPEEKELLAALDPLFSQIPNLKLLIVPRHPERFAEVATLIESHPRRSHLILVDQMGVLNTCYQLSTLAIVGGSFTDQVGGHNILEPILVNVPTLFGPHMQSQLDLVELALDSGAGIQTSLAQLPTSLLDLLKNRPDCTHLQRSIQGSAKRTLAILNKSFAL